MLYTRRRNLTLLEEAGAELVFFSPLHDPLPHGIGGIYLGGGYPERHAAALAANTGLLAAVKAFAEAGGVVYAECGGLLYVSQSIQPLDDLPRTMGAPLQARMPGALMPGICCYDNNSPHMVVTIKHSNDSAHRHPWAQLGSSLPL